MNRSLLLFLSLVLIFLLVVHGAFAGDSPKDKLINAIRSRAENSKAKLGVAVTGFGDHEPLLINGGDHFPMQSVYKFPLALSVLDQVDNGLLSLDQIIHIKKEEIDRYTHSPMLEKYPDQNIAISLRDLLFFTVSKSDNNGCDVLFRLLGGPKKVHDYISGLGINNINILNTEAEMKQDWAVQFANSSTPLAAVQLLEKYYTQKILSESSRDFLWSIMASSVKSDRIKGALPPEAVVAHKAGTSGRNEEGIMAALNDVGIVKLPSGKHFSIAVFITGSQEDSRASAKIIADISRLVWDYFLEEEVKPSGQKFNYPDKTYSARIDSLLSSKTDKPFNGIIMVARNGETQYSAKKGYSDLDKKTALKQDDRFVIGSVSKQITAVLVLQEYEKGRLNLHDPVKKYLPWLKAGWADTVTIHQLLTHTHGITAHDKPPEFKPGSRFMYSQTGYKMLGEIVEQTSGKSFAVLSGELFKKCSMKNTFHPDAVKDKKLVKAYSTKPQGKPEFEKHSLENYVAAGAFISTAPDLLLWNELLFGQKLLSESTYKLMTTRQENATRDHPIFGLTHYGYGITISEDGGIVQLGQTGFTPGFVSMSYYYPATKTSMVVLSNIDRDTEDFKNTFYYHIQMLKFIRESEGSASTTDPGR